MISQTPTLQPPPRRGLEGACSPAILRVGASSLRLLRPRTSRCHWPPVFRSESLDSPVADLQRKTVQAQCENYRKRDPGQFLAAAKNLDVRIVQRANGVLRQRDQQGLVSRCGIGAGILPDQSVLLPSPQHHFDEVDIQQLRQPLFDRRSDCLPPQVVQVLQDRNAYMLCEALHGSLDLNSSPVVTFSGTSQACRR